MEEPLKKVINDFKNLDLAKFKELVNKHFNNLSELTNNSFNVAKIVKMGDYNYVLNPLTDIALPLEPAILWFLGNEISKKINKEEVDKLLTAEAQGIHITTVVSLLTGIPMVVARRHKYGLPGEVKLDFNTGYEKDCLYLNGIKEGDRVVFIDDVISTGGTALAVIKALRKKSVDIKGFYCLVNKPQYKGIEKVEKETGIKPRTLLDLKIIDGKVEIKLNKEVINSD